MIPLIHSFVTHAKLPELGIGEILSADADSVSIRFACGERNFIRARVSEHLVVTTSVPPSPPGTAWSAKKAAAAG